jgi:hypothetical protein
MNSTLPLAELHAATPASFVAAEQRTVTCVKAVTEKLTWTPATGAPVNASLTRALKVIR